MKKRGWLRIVELLLIFGLVCAGFGFSASLFGVSAAVPSVKVNINPHVIGPNDGYTVHIWDNNGPITGDLDYDLTQCNLNFSDCNDYTGLWYHASNGYVTVPSNQNFPQKIYLVRYRKDPQGSWSNYETLIVTDRQNPSWSYTNDTIKTPVPGSYMIFYNYDEHGNFAGYTRIDVEAAPTTDCGINAAVMLRFTKTRNRAYWNSDEPEQLRWCLENKQGHLAATKEIIYKYNGGNDLSSQQANTDIHVDYSHSLNGTDMQGQLGGYWTFESSKTYNFESDMPEFNSILPQYNKVPSGLTSSNRTYDEISFVSPMAVNTNSPDIDVWHMEMRAPDVAGRALTMRYVETGYYTKKSRLDTEDWAVTEDWTWFNSGIISEIRQWAEPTARCWEPIYTCGTLDKRTQSSVPYERANLIESYVPNTENPQDDKFDLKLADPNNQAFANTLTIHSGQSYELRLLKSPNGTNWWNYSGFVEYNIQGTSTGSLWRDQYSHPIYVSGGHVILGPAAFGNLTNYEIHVRMRPFFTNSKLNTLQQVFNPGNNTAQTSWSNYVSLYIVP